MLADKPILSEESQKLEHLYGKLIGRHNVLCRVENFFDENEVGKQYFDEAQEEVLDSGNASLASMFAIALENMAEKIKDSEEETNVDELYAKIYKLEAENRKMKSKLEQIEQLFKERSN